MRAMTWLIVGFCVAVGAYLYVMGLCHLCDLHEEKKRAKQEAEEKRRKQELQRALEQVEMRKKQEVAQRKRLAEERKQRRTAVVDFRGRETTSAVSS